MRWLAGQKAVLKEGLLFEILFGVIAWIVMAVFGLLKEFVFPIYSANSPLNFFLNLLFYLLVGYLIGLLLRIEKFRKSISRLLTAVPGVSHLIKTLEFGERLKKLGKCEVEFEEMPGLFTLGLVTKEWNDSGKIYCSIYNPTQLPPGGKSIKKLKTDIHFTGRSPIDCILTHYLGGLYVQYPAFKKNKNCLCRRCKKNQSPA